MDGRTAAGLALGVAGLFLFNIICGPYAITLGIAGYRRASSHAGRAAAVASILLGAADLVVLAVLVVSRIQAGGFTWYLN